MRILERLQHGIERMYRIETKLAVGDFIIGDEARQQLGVVRAPREQLLLREDDGDLMLALFVDEGVLDKLDRNDPGSALSEDTFGDFLLAIEGVSHFVYVAHCARRERSVSALELELQAEIDKYITCLLTLGTEAERSDRLRRRLFERFAFEDDLDDDERDRYRTANENAHRYSASLERRYLSRQRVADMLRELRRFYRMSLPAKLDFIACAA